MLALAVAAALTGGVQSSASAAGLGRLTVQSALGQPLQAEVEVTSLSREELATLAARLAAPDAFRQAGMEFNPALASLRFAIDRRPDGRAFVKITSTQPINEPFVDLLVELNWASGRFVREYTFLLDPPELRIGRETVEGSTVLSQVTPPAATAPVRAPAAGAATSPAAGASAPAAAAAAARPASAASAPVASTAPAASAAPATTPTRAAAPAAGSETSVVVARGENLTEIANRVKPADITVEQAIIAIYNANPKAFFGTVHQLYAGRTLSIPEASAMRAIDTTDARRQIRMQAADFNAYRQRLAAETRKVDTAEAGTTASGAVSARVDGAATKAATGDQLVLSRPAASGAPATARGGAGTADSQALAEAGVARDAALREQQERVVLLEKNVTDLQKLLELKNQQLADLQRQVEVARGTASPTASGQVVAPVPKPAAAPAPASSPAATAGTDAATSASAAGQGGASDPSASTSAAPAASIAPVRPADDQTAGADRAPAAAQPAPRRVTPPAAPAPAPSLVDELLQSPLLMPGLAAILVALGGFSWYTMRRRRKADSFEDSLIAADAFTANSLFGTTGGQAVDTGGPGSFGASARETGVDVHSTEVDPIAEAEVYIAYGREAQAEEILREALKRQPERQPVRYKLLEIAAGRKDAAAFGLLAAEMHQMTGGENEEWPKVVTLGLSLDPANPLYNGNVEDQAIADFGTDEVDAIAADFEAQEAAFDQLSEEVRSEAGVAEDLVLGVSPMPDSGKPDDEQRPFAETRDMSGRIADDGEAPLDFALSIDTSIGRPAEDLPEIAPKAADGTRSDLERAIDGRFELPSLDFGAASALGTAPDVMSEEAPAFAELGDFRVDLPALEGLDSQGSRPAVQALETEIGALDVAALDVIPAAGDSPQWQEMATKLDLASAYEEIGDKDGARELLDEVVRGGDSDQKRKAQAMLARIG